MKPETKKDICFTMYMIAVIALAAIYFTVPERKEFFDFHVQWWGDFMDVLISFFSQ